MQMQKINMQRVNVRTAEYRYCACNRHISIDTGRCRFAFFLLFCFLLNYRAYSLYYTYMPRKHYNLSGSSKSEVEMGQRNINSVALIQNISC